LSRSVRDAIVSLSLANLCFLTVWLILLNPNHYIYYHRDEYPDYVEFTALVLLILALATLFFLLALFTRRTRQPAVRQIARAGFLLTILWPVNCFIHDYLKIEVSDVLSRSRWIVALSSIASLTTLVLVSRNFKQAVRLAITALIILSPLMAVNLASALWLRSKYFKPEYFETKHPASPVPTRLDGPRIVWVVFDELDWNVVFGSRPEGIQLPEFDRLRAQTLFAENAFPPAGMTLVSMPALFTGQLVEEAKQSHANELMLKMSNGMTGAWSVEDDVFKAARRAGFSTGLNGWYHPYCRVIGDRLDWCSWAPIFDETNPPVARSLPGYASRWFQTAVLKIPLLFRLYRTRYDEQYQLEFRGFHRWAFQRTEQQSESLLRADLNLKFLHYPVPHGPGIYDITTGSLTIDSKSTYIDNLVLADRTLGKIRELLEAGGNWDRSIVLVTSDHWWREAPLVNGKRDHRIPFMLKLAGQKSEVEYKHAFNTILTRDLLLKILQGELNSPTEVMTWIDSNSHLGESPFTRKTP
jgi:hypothetical protein